MTWLARRSALKLIGGAALVAGVSRTIDRTAQAAELGYTPEKNAELRWKRFVQGEEDQFMANTRKFSQSTGVNVRVDSENFEDIRPKAAVAANVGSEPDIIIGWYDDPHQYADKLVDLSELTDYLGGKYGGWYDVARRYCMRDGKWIAIGLGIVGGCLVYRQSMLKAAGFERVPRDLSGFLKLCQALKANGKPAGMAFGNAVGDANAWCHWVLWAHGARAVDENNQVVINSAETLAALDYARELYQTFIPGTLSWLDPNNNKAFLSGVLGLTLNGISIYHSAKTSADPALKALAGDIAHANMPIGMTGRPTELSPFTPMFLLKYSRYPSAAREYLRFMLEREQYEAWQNAVWLRQPRAQGLRVQPGVDSRSQAHAVSRCSQADSGQRPCRPPGRRLGRRHGRLCRGQHGGRSGLRRGQRQDRCGARGEAGAALLQNLSRSAFFPSKQQQELCDA